MATNLVSIAIAFNHLSSYSPFPSYLSSSPHCFLLPMPQTPWRPTQDAGRFPSLKELADLETKFALQASSSQSRIKMALPSSAD